MGDGQVRAILWRHASQGTGQGPARPPPPPGPDSPYKDSLREPALPASLPDPNALLPAHDLAAVLAARGPAEQRRLAADYAALWARTFRTLVTHLRGRPERALALFADEAYPFLRGDRLAARVADAGHRRATLLLAGGLPDAYLCGLVEGFVTLSGASATATAVAPGRIDVVYQVAPADRVARLAQHASALRLNLVLAALLAATLGIALADAQHAALPTWRVATVLGGVAAAQLAANALHALRHGHPAGPLAPLRTGRPALLTQLLGAGLLAAVAAGMLAASTPLVLLFAAGGVGAGFLYAPLRDRGLGPIVILGLYGPLLVEGALHSFAVGAQHVDHLALVPWTLVPGALAAASLYVDDLADAPLDEAGGKRTLAVRLPRRLQGLVYAGLIGLAFLPLLLLLTRIRFGPSPLVALPALALALGALALIVRVRTGLGDPRRLAPARLGTQALHAAATLGLAVLLAGGAA